MLRIRTTLAGFTGGPGLMTHYIACTDENAAAAGRCRRHVQDLLTNVFDSYLWNGVHWTVQPLVDLVTSADGHTIETFIDSGAIEGDGTGGGALSPPANAMLCRHQTSTFVGGKRLRGHVFVSPLSANALESDGTFPNTTLAAKNAVLADILSGLPGTDRFHVWHRPKAGVGGYSGEIHVMTLQDKVAILRSRRD